MARATLKVYAVQSALPWVLALPMDCPGSAVGQDVVRELLDRGSYPAAIRAADRLPDRVERSQVRVEVLYSAGDLAGALRTGLDGLMESPGDLTLEWRMTQITLALRIPDLAREHLLQFEKSLAAASLDRPEDVGWWRAQWESCRTKESQLGIEYAELELASQRARATAIAGICLALWALVALAKSV